MDVRRTKRLTRETELQEEETIVLAEAESLNKRQRVSRSSAHSSANTNAATSKSYAKTKKEGDDEKEEEVCGEDVTNVDSSKEAIIEEQTEVNSGDGAADVSRDIGAVSGIQESNFVDDEIVKNDTYWTAKNQETNTQKCSSNLLPRLNRVFGKQNVELNQLVVEEFDERLGWGPLLEKENNNKRLCLCGQSLTKGRIISSKSGKQILLGFNCQKKIENILFEAFLQNRDIKETCRLCNSTVVDLNLHVEEMHMDYISRPCIICGYIYQVPKNERWRNECHRCNREKREPT